MEVLRRWPPAEKRDMLTLVVRCMFAFVLLVLSSELGCSFTLTWKYAFIPIALILAFLCVDLLFHVSFFRNWRLHVGQTKSASGGSTCRYSSRARFPWLLRVVTRPRLKVGLNALFYALTICGLVLLFLTAEKFCEADSTVVAYISVREAEHYPHDQLFEFFDGQVHRELLYRQVLTLDNTTAALLPYLLHDGHDHPDAIALLVAPVVPSVLEWAKHKDPVSVWAYAFGHEPAEWQEEALHQGSRAPAAVASVALGAIVSASLAHNVSLPDETRLTILQWTDVEGEVMYIRKTEWLLLTGAVMYVGLILIALALPAHLLLEAFYVRKLGGEEDDSAGEGQYLLQEFRIIPQT